MQTPIKMLSSIKMGFNLASQNVYAHAWPTVPLWYHNYAEGEEGRANHFLGACNASYLQETSLEGQESINTTHSHVGLFNSMRLLITTHTQEKEGTKEFEETS